jgi:hypothetical protein
MSEFTKKKSGFPLLPIIGVGAVIVAAGGAYLYFQSGIFGKELKPSEAARIIPQNALMASYVNTDSETWSQLSKFGTPEAQKIVQENLQTLQKEAFPAEENISYEKDIQPWIGGVMFAFLPEQTQGRVQQPSAESGEFLAIIGIKDKLKALDFAKKQTQKAEQKSVESDYQGIKITEVTDKNNNKYSWANFDNYIVVSPEKQTIEKAVDAYKGKPSLAQKTGTNEIFSDKLSLKNSLAQIYITDYSSLISQMSATGDTPLPPETLQQLQQVGAMVMGVGVEDQGLRMQALAKLAPNAPEITIKPSKGEILSQFPANTIAFVSGSGIKETWTQVVSQADKDPQVKTIVDSVRQSLQSVNLDADRDVFGWMDGDFAIGAIDTGNVNLQAYDPGLGGAIVIESSDRNTAQQTLDKLQSLVQSNAGPYITFNKKNLQGTDVTEWSSPGVGNILSYGWLNNSLTIAIKLPFENLSKIESKAALKESPTFKTAVASLPQSNYGYFYLDTEKVMSKVTSFSQASGGVIPPEVTAITNSMQGIAMTVTMPDAKTSQMDMMLALKPAQENK